MNLSGISYFFAVSGSVFLHACLIALMYSNWQTESVREMTPQPRIINATLVELESKAPEPAKPQTQVVDLAAKRRAEQQAAAEEARLLAQRQRDEEERKRLEEQRLKDEAERNQREEDEKLAEQERLKKLEEERVARQQQMEQQRLSDFEQALAQEEAYQAQVEEASMVGSVTAEISRIVSQNWSRPPSARRGMKAVLSVSLVPTGGVSSVDVVDSSGDPAFDRSATLAVQKSAPFEVVKDISPIMFEKNFRTFLFEFSPQDLRL